VYRAILNDDGRNQNMEIDMDNDEFKAWKDFQTENAGHWKLDPIHNGTNGQDLMVRSNDWDCLSFSQLPMEHRLRPLEQL